jgi:outer membrane protein assembly factor BamB
MAFSAATGAPLWNSGSSTSGTIQNGATLVNGRVYAVDWNDTIYAFGL